ncbi:sugar phosphate isomerase/epimerase family protein [Pelagicoccus mobilis]|uniref:Sugar phosphate isomerase/epimerase n=1 Tax=Pelagicoccus mobilis TaxID=415221 RepID=A0A934RXR8_9BACT|nr:TIM barrel protein [Pelagicoccus mobilis]MBK1878278.1 sugar phosphate isomerase/epimerase [Pelagicoccus mobilis]
MAYQTRRKFIQSATGTLAACTLTPLANSKPNSTVTPLCTNQYPWDTFYRRSGKEFYSDLNQSIREIAESGAQSLEPNLESIEQVNTISRALEINGLEMRSIYVNSVLHEADQANASIEKALRIASEAQEKAGTKIVVTNPSPISWGGPENKTDKQLVTQAKALETLGKKLSQEGLTLAYHNHDSELRLGARELHHCLASTNPEYVKYCLDSHWVYRGCEDSNVALFDVVELYASRIVELHLRQSTNGVWDESFSTQGDVDYHRLLTTLQEKEISPLIVAEQAVEKQSPNTLDALSAHKITHANIRTQFAAFL